MRFYNRKGILYISVNGVRKSTKLPYNKDNIKLVKSYHKNDEFFNKMGIVKDFPKIVDICKEVLEKKNIKQTSYLAYESLLNSRIVPFFGSKRVNEIKPKDIEKFYYTFSDYSTLTTCLALLKPAFKSAVVREYIQSSPLNDVEKPKFKSSYTVKPFSLDEIEKILKVDTNIKNLLGVLFFTGIRIGEAFGLKWSDIDFENYEIHIKRTITKGIEQTPKTDSSYRVIDMLPQAENYLNAQKFKTGMCEYVFAPIKRKRYNSLTGVHKAWLETLKKCEFEPRELYQTRHSFASNMLSNYESIMWVSAMLGHKNPAVTLGKYSRFVRTKRERKTTFLDTKIAHTL